MQAANGHQGLPPSVSMAPGLAAQMPASAGSSSDVQMAKQAETHLTAFAAAAKDPQLKALFSQCLNALHKYLAQDQKEQQQSLQGKLSPKIMAQAHGRA